MEKKMKIKVLTLSYLIFVLALVLSGTIGDGIGSDVVYLLAFVLPIMICEVVLLGMGEWDAPRLSVSGEGWLLSLTLIAPFILITSLISLGTSSLIYALFGTSQSVELDGSVALNVLSHALVPAVLEEMLFRYLPSRMMRDYRGWVTVLVSALAFSVAHVSVYSIPYAFVAGCILMGVTLASGSALPAIFVHFINNLCSVLLMTYGGVEDFKIWYYVIICLLFAISLAVILIFRNKFIGALQRALASGERAEFPRTTLFYILPVLLVAVMNFISGLQSV